MDHFFNVRSPGENKEVEMGHWESYFDKSKAKQEWYLAEYQERVKRLVSQ